MAFAIQAGVCCNPPDYTFYWGSYDPADTLDCTPARGGEQLREQRVLLAHGLVSHHRDLPVAWRGHQSDDAESLAFHTDQDQAVPVRGSRRMIEALRRAGGNPRHTELTGHGHDVWTVAYRDVEVPRRLLVQRRT